MSCCLQMPEASLGGVPAQHCGYFKTHQSVTGRKARPGPSASPGLRTGSACVLSSAQSFFPAKISAEQNSQDPVNEASRGAAVCVVQTPGKVLTIPGWGLT